MSSEKSKDINIFINKILLSDGKEITFNSNVLNFSLTRYGIIVTFIASNTTSSESNISMFDKTGKEIWKADVSNSAVSDKLPFTESGEFADGRIFAAWSTDEKVVELDPKTGKLIKILGDRTSSDKDFELFWDAYIQRPHRG